MPNPDETPSGLPVLTIEVWDHKSEVYQHLDETPKARIEAQGYLLLSVLNGMVNFNTNIPDRALLVYHLMKTINQLITPTGKATDQVGNDIDSQMVKELLLSMGKRVLALEESRG